MLGFWFKRFYTDSQEIGVCTNGVLYANSNLILSNISFGSGTRIRYIDLSLYVDIVNPTAIESAIQNVWFSKNKNQNLELSSIKATFVDQQKYSSILKYTFLH